MAKDISLEIGFSGGGSTAIAVPEADLEGILGAVTKGQPDRWYTVSSSDGGQFIVDLASVVFVRVGARNRSIGFANA